MIRGKSQAFNATVACWVGLLLISCSSGTKRNTAQEIVIGKKDSLPTVQSAQIAVDSFPIVREKNRGTPYTEPILLGFRFGMSSVEYNRHLNDLSRKGLVNHGQYTFYCKSPDNTSSVVEIKSNAITPFFHKNKLWKLELVFYNSHSCNYLEHLYTEKYGKYMIKGNMLINVYLLYNDEYEPGPLRQRANSNSPRMYYASSQRGNGAPLTREYAYTHLVYKDYVVEEEIKEEEKHRAIEIEGEKARRERERQIKAVNQKDLI